MGGGGTASANAGSGSCAGEGALGVRAAARRIASHREWSTTPALAPPAPAPSAVPVPGTAKKWLVSTIDAAERKLFSLMYGYCGEKLKARQRGSAPQHHPFFGRLNRRHDAHINGNGLYLLGCAAFEEYMCRAQSQFPAFEPDCPRMAGCATGHPYEHGCGTHTQTHRAL